MNNITFIHAADIHLDSTFKGLSEIPDLIFDEIKNSTFSALEALIAIAIDKKVDFILLSGDIFDQESPSLKAQIYLRNAFERLHTLGIHVYLSYGNHDFTQCKTDRVTYPDNVHIFQKNEVSSFIYRKQNKDLAEITGFSYETRAVKREMIQDYPVKSSIVPFHIGMLHGSLYGNEEHQTYAPFRLQQLKEKQYDYWALGHIHKRQVLQEAPPIIYPGNTQGRHRKETGVKGCYYVEMYDGHTNIEFISLEAVRFTALRLDISEAESIEEVEQILNKGLIDTGGNKPQLIHLTCEYTEPAQFGQEPALLLNELTELMNERLLLRSPWSYIYRFKINTSTDDLPKVNPMFMDEIKKALQEMDIQNEIAELKNNQKGHSYLTFDDEETLRGETEKLLMTKLLHRSGEGQ